MKKSLRIFRGLLLLIPGVLSLRGNLYGVLIFAVMFGSLPALALAECTLTMECGGGYGTRSSNFRNRSSCEAELRKTRDWLQSSGGGCTITNACGCTGTSPPSYDYEAERKRQEGLERERQRLLAEEIRKKEKFEKEKQEAVKSLKGVSPAGEMGLKGADTIKDRRSPLFGIKGVGDTGIKDIKPSKQERGVSTAWKQLHCASELSGYALEKATRKDGPVDINEVRYLADEAIKALNGERLGVKCSEAPPPTKPYGQKGLDSAKLIPFYKNLLSSAVIEAEKVNKAEKDISGLKEKKRLENEKVERLKKESKEEAINKAIDEDKAYEEKERQRIEEAHKKQKENESALEEAMKALMEAQKLINQRNSEKGKALSELRRLGKINRKALYDPEGAAKLLK